MKPSPPGEEDELIAFVNWWATRIWGIDPDSDDTPAKAALRARESGVSATLRLAGLRQAARDCVSSAADLPVAKVEEIDAELRAADLKTLTSYRAGLTRLLARLLKSGRLRSDSDYYFARNVLDDRGIAIPEADRIALAAMTAEWEASARSD
jgi:hypothetical protein